MQKKETIAGGAMVEQPHESEPFQARKGYGCAPSAVESVLSLDPGGEALRTVTRLAHKGYCRRVA